MRISLLDVNILIALLDPAHPNHEEAHEWFGRNRRHGWATCTITINGCIRILSNPGYPTVQARPEEVAAHLRQTCACKYHEFWNDSTSLLDSATIRPEMIGSCRKITDVSLLALACRNAARLVTFDRSIPLNAVAGATQDHLLVLGVPPRN
ncbi:MAG: PIN domain-containing protein [Acidobacteriota bacterium]|nr:PIN domain-containing protein [Acidobacteriota bacterium]